MMAEADTRSLLVAGMTALGLENSGRRAGLLLAYLDLLARWNRAYNLTAVQEEADQVVRHLLDSLAVAHLLTGERFMDVGSGAGLPGLPLAIVYPQRSWALVDASAKRVRFLRHAVARLGLENVECVHARVEDYEAAEAFDTVLSRAYASLADFAGSAGCHCAADGCLAAMKGRLPEEELAGLPPGWRVTGLHRLTVPGLDAERHLVVMTQHGAGRGGRERVLQGPANLTE
jgi:16S rRNA (guanine527-N7)-methyltransferase